MTNNKIYLNQCTKCGYNESVLTYNSYNHAYIYCNVCGTIGQSADTAERAAELWNIHNNLNKEPTMTDNTTTDVSWYNNYRKEVESKHATMKNFLPEALQEISIDVNNAMIKASKNAPFKFHFDSQGNDKVYNKETGEVIASTDIGYDIDELQQIKYISNNNYIFIKALEAFLKHGFKLYYKQKD